MFKNNLSKVHKDILKFNNKETESNRFNRNLTKKDIWVAKQNKKTNTWKDAQCHESLEKCKCK